MDRIHKPTFAGVSHNMATVTQNQECFKLIVNF